MKCPPKHPMVKVGVVPLVLVLGTALGDLSVKRQHQPEVDGSELGSEQASAEDLINDGDELDHPPTEDFLALRQRNAELALEVEELTSELRQLHHDKKMTVSRTKFTVNKIKHHCRATPAHNQKDASVSHHRHAKTSEGVATMPWSLTHTGTRHKMQSHYFPGEGMFKGITDYFSRGSSAVAAVGDYLRKIPVLSNPAEEKENQVKQGLKEIEDNLIDSRVRLGKNKEAGRSLEEHFQALTARVAQQKAEAEADAAALDQAAKTEQDLDKQIANAKAAFQKKVDEFKREHTVETVKGEVQSESSAEIMQREQVQNVSRSLHAEVERRMNESARKVETLKAQNYQLQTQIDETKAGMPDKRSRIESLKTRIANLTSTSKTLTDYKEHLLREESSEETRVAKEDQELMAMAGQLETCDDWGRKIEKKLNKVIQSKKDDAQLCHKSILGLHSERVKLKQELHKQHMELKHQKQEAASLQKEGDSTLEMLNQCLGRLK